MSSVDEMPIPPYEQEIQKQRKYDRALQEELARQQQEMQRQEIQRQRQYTQEDVARLKELAEQSQQSQRDPSQ